MIRQSYDVLFVGSVPLGSAEEVFRTIASIVGERASRLTDGETGPRLNWIEWQAPVFEAHPLFQRYPTAGLEMDWRNEVATAEGRLKGWHYLKPGADVSKLSFGPLGYASVARESFEVFARLKREGVVQPGCRFQISIPTPYNVLDQRLPPEQRLEVEKPYEKRMLEEIDEIASSLPHDEIAIQWDAAHEIENLDGARPHWFDNAEQGIIERLARLAEHIPADIELGYHFCYGDFQHRHIVEPKDTGLMVRVANRLSTTIKRPIGWFHMPVPRDRADKEYFAPLSGLRLANGTKLYLGLIHFTDGIAGTRARLVAAREFVKDFGIATECGLGRRPRDTIPALLRLHAAASDLAAEVA
jgi:methionine synthase II (cobalamin-independent)